jgi:Domain of Unknown Function (DUF928)
MKPIFKLAIAVLCLGLVTSTDVLEANAKPTDGVQIAARTRRRLAWRTGVRPSRYRIGGFSRSASCPNQAKITAFVPPARMQETLSKAFSPVDTTLSAHPTIWLHLTSIPPNAQVQFTLQDAAGRKQLYNTRFQLTGQTGILGVQIPKTAPELKVGESYLWQLAVQCDRQDPSSDVLVIGSWLQRVSPAQIKSLPGFDPKPIVQELSRAAEIDKPALYASLGVWQDAVTTLIELQRQQPNNQELKEDWRSLLTGAQMAEFINAPILGTK